MTHDPRVMVEKRAYGSNWSDGAGSGGDSITGTPEVFGYRLLVGRVYSRRKRCVQDNRGQSLHTLRVSLGCRQPFNFLQSNVTLF